MLERHKTRSRAHGVVKLLGNTLEMSSAETLKWTTKLLRRLYGTPVMRLDAAVGRAQVKLACLCAKRCVSV
jgi:hypothetical protein